MLDVHKTIIKTEILSNGLSDMRFIIKNHATKHCDKNKEIVAKMRLMFRVASSALFVNFIVIFIQAVSAAIPIPIANGISIICGFISVLAAIKVAKYKNEV